MSGGRLRSHRIDACVLLRPLGFHPRMEWTLPGEIENRTAHVRSIRDLLQVSGCAPFANGYREGNRREWGPRSDKRLSRLDILLPRPTAIQFHETLVQPERLEQGQVLRSH